MKEFRVNFPDDYSEEGLLDEIRAVASRHPGMLYTVLVAIIGAVILVFFARLLSGRLRA